MSIEHRKYIFVVICHYTLSEWRLQWEGVDSLVKQTFPVFNLFPIIKVCHRTGQRFCGFVVYTGEMHTAYMRF